MNIHYTLLGKFNFPKHKILIYSRNNLPIQYERKENRVESKTPQEQSIEAPKKTEKTVTVGALPKKIKN